MPAYFVLFFETRTGEKFVRIAVKSWIVESMKCVYWPPKSQGKTRMDNSYPDYDKWIKMPYYKKVGPLTSIEEARRCEQEALLRDTDVDTDDLLAAVRSLPAKRIPKPSRRFSSSDDDDGRDDDAAPNEDEYAVPAEKLPQKRKSCKPKKRPSDDAEEESAGTRKKIRTAQTLTAAPRFGFNQILKDKVVPTKSAGKQIFHH